VTAVRRTGPAHLSRDDARRIALAAQGFDRRRPDRPPGPAALLALVRRLGLLQLDFVSVLLPSHYLVPYSRLGPYDRARLDALAYRRRTMTEGWAREASLVPVETWPLLLCRSPETDRRTRALEAFLREHAAYAARALREVRARGPLTAAELPPPPGATRHERDDWGWSPARAVLEGLLARGTLAVVRRRADRARVYDLAERVLPAEVLDRVPARRRAGRDAAFHELLLVAARAAGVGTAGDLADGFRIPVRDARRLVAHLAAEGALREVRVDGWKEPAFLHPTARRPKAIDARALLSPFDPLVCHRARALRLFGFDYRWEIFTPAAKRRWGTHVLPFLLGDRLVARVDLRADRAAGRLEVRSARAEPGVDRRAVERALDAELHLLAGWLDLPCVHFKERLR
jgi:hypothetical protein